MAAETKRRRRKATGTISAEELLREIPAARVTAHDVGTFLFRENSKGTACFFLVQGRVRVLKRNTRGDEVPVALAKPGDFLGEMSMLSGERRSASAYTLTRVKAISVEHADFIALLVEFSTLLATRCHNLLRLVARQPDMVPLDVKKVTQHDVRAVLEHVHTLWAV